MSKEDSRFVYLYLDVKGTAETPVYVGRGTAERVTEHGAEDDNHALAEVIRGGTYAVEVLDCGDARTAEIVEGALISAMLGRSKTHLKNRRRDKFSFVPLGVPLALGSRRGEPALEPEEIARKAGGPVLLVRIGPNDLSDPDRGVIDPGNPSDEAVRDRLRQWWFIRSWVDSWASGETQSPAALVGIAGTKHRYVLGSIDLRGIDWDTVDWRGKAASIPLRSQDGSELDAYGLRGRTVANGSIFGRLNWQLAQLYGETGKDRKAKQLSTVAVISHYCERVSGSS